MTEDRRPAPGALSSPWRNWSRNSSPGPIGSQPPGSRCAIAPDGRTVALAPTTDHEPVAAAIDLGADHEKTFSRFEEYRRPEACSAITAQEGATPPPEAAS